MSEKAASVHHDEAYSGRRRPNRLGYALFLSRWLQFPLYVGLIVAQAVYVWRFLLETWDLARHGFSGHGADGGPFTESDVMLTVLQLVDIVMISNLLIMVIVGGYETFVSRIRLRGHPDEPEWLSHVNANVLKAKLATAIIGISSIHLLRTFIKPDKVAATGEIDVTAVMWQAILHSIFILSAIGLSVVDRIMSGTEKLSRTHREAGYADLVALPSERDDVVPATVNGRDSAR
ncbi:TIGR00645 family protein [Amycolatopsis sp. NPDC059021]|uniref:TIGR00645 family protein n=1 Tax=Amycolatopsis sp. NPDC059021 TaxID=3346704 RepID=UPI00366D57F7